MPFSTPIYMGSVAGNTGNITKYNFLNGFTNNSFDSNGNISYSSKGPGSGVYLFLITTINNTIRPSDNTVSLTAINTNTRIYLLVVSSSTQIDSTNNSDYGVAITPLFGRDISNGFNITNMNTRTNTVDMSTIYINIATNDSNTYHMWYVKLF